MKNNTCVDIFIASSSEKLSVALKIAEYFDRAARLADKTGLVSATTWMTYFENAGGEYCWETVCTAVNKFDYAIFLLGKDDEAEVRGEKYQITRDNVLIEAGAFMSNLPQQHVRCFYAKGVRMPSDFLGINHTEFSFNKRAFTKHDEKVLDNLFESCKKLATEKEALSDKDRDRGFILSKNNFIASEDDAKIYKTGKDAFKD